MVDAPRKPSDPDETRLRELVGAVVEGDELALRQLFDESARWVFSAAVRILHDRQRAEEVTLDVYMWAWSRAQRYDPSRGSVMTWLLTAARSRALDALRARESRARTEAVLAQRLPRADPSTQDAQVEVVALTRALALLPAEQRQVIELAYFPGLTHVEIAERIGEPLGTVKSRIRLGIHKLRDVLAPQVQA